MVKTELKNLFIIKDSIRELYSQLGVDKIRTFANDFKIPEVNNSHSDPVIEVQNIAKEISKYYRLEIGTVVVSFTSNLDCPGRIELSRSKDFFIELNLNHKGHYDEIRAILAHEITHIFLYRLGISFKNTYENEILTDTTAAYLGFGQAMIDSYKVDLYYDSSHGKTKEEKYIGYIAPDEIGYIVGKRVLFFENKDINECPHSFEWGIKNAFLDIKKPPYASASIPSKYSYKIRKMIFIRNKGNNKVSKSLKGHHKYGYSFDNAINPNIIFDCRNCFQKLRLRLNQKNVKIRCPICKIEYSCST